MSGMRPLPKTLQRLVAAHPDKFDEGWSEQDGFNERDPYNGWAHWLYLKKGWCYPEHGAHIIHEDNVKACLEAFKDVEPCDCADCMLDNDERVLVKTFLRSVSIDE